MNDGITADTNTARLWVRLGHTLEVRATRGHRHKDWGPIPWTAPHTAEQWLTQVDDERRSKNDYFKWQFRVAR